MSQKQKRLVLVMPGNRWVTAEDVASATFGPRCKPHKLARVGQELRTLVAEGGIRVRHESSLPEYLLESAYARPIMDRDQAERNAAAMQAVRR